ncbi:MAG: F0F1 ATP synthase subunit gamma [Candidatus Symbiothrix sp.]|jgi:F-type H+-transporting ATPase subunit gamma|nr:F0F1 ATP synthase subunit gamma [Candidatus Symbiothrix sp.]
MASLKEIKGRIASVKSTQKITSAMKMVASAALRKAQSRIESFLPYQQKLDEMFRSFISFVTDFDSNLKEEREIQGVAIVVFSSNSGLCGAFNSNILKLLKETLQKYRHLPHSSLQIYPVGKKVEAQVRRMNLPYQVMGSYTEWIDKPTFDGAKTIANELINNFLAKKIDKVELVYNHFKSAGVQVSTAEQYLPVIIQETDAMNFISTDYIIEPDRPTILHSLLPKSLHSKMYAVALDSAAAEQAARVVAMQIATDNAGDLLDELTIQYNKQRQQVITSELLDIIGGSEALK